MQTMCQMHEGHTAEAEKQALNNVIALFSWDFNRKKSWDKVRFAPAFSCQVVRFAPAFSCQVVRFAPAVLLSGGAIRPSCSMTKCEPARHTNKEQNHILASNSDCWNEIN